MNRGLVVSLLDAALELEHDGAGGVDHLYVVVCGSPVGLRGFSMGTQKHLYVVQAVQVIMGYGLQSFPAQAFHFVAVVHYVAQAEKGTRLLKFLFGLAYCGYDTETVA